jgi:hypothetical protein
MIYAAFKCLPHATDSGSFSQGGLACMQQQSHIYFIASS